MKSLILALLAAMALPSAKAATVYSGSWTVSTSIPDNDDVGFSSVQDLGIGGSELVTSVVVELVFSGGWNGDLYAYLVHNGQLSILLNRVGKSSTRPDGFSSSGMTVTLSDAAASDIHLALGDGASPTGTFQPDGRDSDPLWVLDTDARTKPLSVFNGSSGAGNWTLFVADQSAGEVSVLESWSIEVVTIPEPSGLLLALVPLAFFVARRRR